MTLIQPTFFERHKAACIIGGVLVLILAGLWAFWR